MKIIVSREGMLWNDQSPALVEYAEDVIVISYYMGEPQKHEAKYKYLDVKIPEMLGMDENGAMTSVRYRALTDNLDRLQKLIGCDYNIMILSDNSISSLFPYKLLQSLCEKFRLHLWTIAPLSFQGRREIAAYNEMVAELNNTKSVLAMKLEISEEHRKMTMPQYMEYIQKQINELFPNVYKQIGRMYDHYDRKYFFDFNKGAYIDTTFEKGFISIEDDFEYSTLGRMSYEGMVAMEKENQRFIIQRSDGKELCNKLKHARNDLATANGIDFHTEDCSFNGACGGTCPKCDEELNYLMEKLSEIEPEKRVYPELIIDEKFVSGHGNKKQSKQSDEPIMGVPVRIKKNDEIDSLEVVESREREEKKLKIPEFLRREKNE